MKQSFLNSESFIFLCMCLAVFRIYLEVVSFKFAELPMTKKLGAQGEKVHRYGLYMAIGYIVLFAPQVLFY